MLTLPPRYEAVLSLGAGGGGEVWAVRDRVTGARLALKALAETAGDQELLALVREATTLSGLEGLGVPRVLAFGKLPGSGRRYLVRELVPGRSLESIFDASKIDKSGEAWLEPLAHAADQLTALHRAGLLHGDVKPANIIANGPLGTLVDLGLSAPWREGGTRAHGFTPKYAAPELLTGSPLTVRAEVYSLGASLGEGLARRGAELRDESRIELAKVAAKATSASPDERYPSTSELAIALRRAAGLGEPMESEPAWPVLGIEPIADELLAAAHALPEGGVLVITAKRGSGRTTLARRLAWSLGTTDGDVSWLDAEGTARVRTEVLNAETSGYLSGGPSTHVIVADDLDAIDEPTLLALAAAISRGVKAIVVGSLETAKRLAPKAIAFALPPLPSAVAHDLTRRAIPSLPDAVATHLVEKADGRAGKLRWALRALAGQPVVSIEDVDLALASEDSAMQEQTPEDSLRVIERCIDAGRLADADRRLALIVVTPALAVRVAIARARLAHGQGDANKAIELLDATPANHGALERAWSVVRARALVRAGSYKEAAALANKVLAKESRDVLAAEALVALGVALAFSGDEQAGKDTLLRAVDVARAANDARIVAVALGSLAIVHLRLGDAADAKRAYEGALAAAESARDVSTVATMRLNLAGIARTEGDLALALKHLEAAVDLGNRAGGVAAVQQAALNLANLDLYLGRTERARAAIDELKRKAADPKEAMGASARAQLLGLEAELESRTGDAKAARQAYEACARAYEAQGRALDAAEARLEAWLAARDVDDPRALLAQIDATEKALGGFKEHEAFAWLVRGTLFAKLGADDEARRALDRAIDGAIMGGQQERAFWALEARRKMFSAQGSLLLARKDAERGVGLLEETASRLPRDLREVFWNDPERRALRGAVMTTQESPSIRGAVRELGGAHEVSTFAPRPAEDKLRRILEITRELASERDLNRLLAKVTDHAIALLGGERGFVVLAEDSGLVAHAARDRKGDESHAAFSRSVAERVVRTGEPVVATKAREDARLAEAVSVHQLMIQSVACVPVRGAPPVKRTIGALYVETRLRAGLRFEDELPTLMAFADQAAIAIESARLFEENLARNKELERQSEELAKAKDRLAEMLAMREEQLSVTRKDLQKVRQELRGHFGYAGLVGTSAPMRKVYALIDRVKDTDVPVLITGESGTGKEVVARAIHSASARGRKSFLGVNCGAIPANLLESELFGHVRGAFTGAERDRKGLFRECEGGTLLLDEVGELPLKMQTGLLRVLQEHTVRPVGGTKEEPVDVRIVAATNRNLEEMVKAQTFREDLFYRLHVVQLAVPPLRERVEDVPPLIDHFLTLFASRYSRDKKTIGKLALRKLSAYDWPGNVRQLEHVLLNAWLMSEAKEIEADDVSLPEPRGAAPSANRQKIGAPASPGEYKDSEKDRILRALQACGWNRMAAAKMTGIPRRTFYRRLKEFGILE